MTYDELVTLHDTLRWIDADNPEIRSVEDWLRVQPLVRPRLVSIYTCGATGTVRARLKQAGRLALVAGLPSPGDGTRS